MSYIYDVLVNFQKEYYDFFEWNKNDNIYHIRKIPIFKINNAEYKNIKDNIVKFEQKFLNLINLKTEQFKQNNISKIKYCFIISNGKEAIAIKLNKNAVTTHKSDLLPNETDDLLELIKLEKETKINFKIIKTKTPNNFKTRFEIENEKFLYEQLDKIYKQNNFQKLNYLCLECFNKEEKNSKNAYLKLKEEIKNTNQNFQKLYNIFKIITQK